MHIWLSLMLMAAGISYASAAEVASGLLRAEENTLSICVVLEVSAVFRDDTSSDVQTDREAVCSAAFQVSSTEVVTSAHVIKNPKDMLLERFANEQKRFSVHGIIFNRAIPMGDMEVVFYYELYSSDGAYLTSPLERFVAPWGGEDPTHVAVQRLAKYLETVEIVVDATIATAQVAAVEDGVDLALFWLDIPIERSAYIDVLPKDHPLDEEVWGFAANPPSQFSEGMPTVLANHGVIKGVYEEPTVESVALDPDLRVHRVSTDHINPPGVSGGPVVDHSGTLVGITMASTIQEQQMSTFDVVPPCNTTMPSGNFLTCHRTLVPAQVVYDFLVRNRMK